MFATAQVYLSKQNQRKPEIKRFVSTSWQGLNSPPGECPLLGQGANCALEDCMELNRLLQEKNDDWAEVTPFVIYFLVLHCVRKSEPPERGCFILEGGLLLKNVLIFFEFHCVKMCFFSLKAAHPWANSDALSTEFRRFVVSFKRNPIFFLGPSNNFFYVRTRIVFLFSEPMSTLVTHF